MQSAVGTARAAGRHFLGPSLLRIGRGCCGLSGSARQQQLRVKSFCVGASTCDSSGSSGGHIDARQCTTRSGPCSSSTCSSNVKYACTSGSPTYCCSLASCRAPVKAEIQRSFPAGRLLGLLHRPFFCDAGNLFMSTRSAFHAAANARAPQEQQRRQRQQQHEQQQQQPEATSASVQAPLPDGVAYPADYAGLPVPSSTTRTGASKSNSDSHGAGSSSSSSSSPTVEQLGMLPAWARRRLPPRREVLFLRVLPVAPLVGMALGVHLLPRKLDALRPPWPCCLRLCCTFASPESRAYTSAWASHQLYMSPSGPYGFRVVECLCSLRPGPFREGLPLCPYRLHRGAPDSKRKRRACATGPPLFPLYYGLVDLKIQCS